MWTLVVRETRTCGEADLSRESEEYDDEVESMQR